MTASDETNKPKDFIRDIIAADLSSGKHTVRLVSSCPPEQNGYLHHGNTESI